MQHTLGVGALFICLIALSSTWCAAATPQAPTNGKSVREDAIRSIPFDKLSAEDRQRVEYVVSNPSIFRRLPTQVIDCDPDLHLFLVRHPDVIVNIWDVMGISKVTLQRNEDGTFTAADGAGAAGTLKYAYSGHDTHVIVADGTYEGPLFTKPVKARCVLVLRTGYVQETNRRYYATNRLDAFIRIEHVGVDLVAKTISPLITKSADYNFIETAAFIANVSRTAEVNSRGMVRLANKLTALDDDVRDQFAQVSMGVSEKAAKRQAAPPAPPVSRAKATAGSTPPTTAAKR